MYISAAVGRWIDQSVSFYDEMGWAEYIGTHNPPGGISFLFLSFLFLFLFLFLLGKENHT